MKKSLLAVCLILLAGCVDFDEQTLLLFYRMDRDELHLLVLYRGIHFDNEKEKSMEQLNSFVGTNWEIALGDNWIGHVTRQKLEDSLVKEKSPESMKKFITMLLKNITVTNGNFFLGPDKKLCGSQTVILKEASQVIRQLNLGISDLLIDDEKSLRDRWVLGTDTEDLIFATARKGHSWFELTPHALHFSFPMTDSDFIKTKRKLLEEAGEQVRNYSANKKTVDDAVRLLSQNEISMVREGTMIRFIVGNPSARRPAALATRQAGKKFENNLTEYVEKKFGISKDLNEEQVVDTFVTTLVTEEQQARIKEMINTLGSFHLKTREQSSQALIEMGGLAVPWVRKAARNSDPEIRQRAKAVLHAIAWWEQ